ncbi:quinate dehydrogenase [Aspergillus terreus NIH2624]|uniref:Quinate dehydrogenase n=1 Tax=Aspergillus terreus (strain NIH 2624 / FGSC A1156) TaxID=341663 RepID=Q0D134_ASPTN|nr:quinate dehydrogenase [Aspergillus terreus NIH2624]EAU38996.1 quinate dehydrogenase [Aspergillus terreus NIH2624]
MAAPPTTSASSGSPPEEPILIPDHLDGVAYLYGHPLLNSLSPPLHQTVYNALGLNWTQIPLSSVCGTSATYPPPYTRSPPIDKFLASIRANPKFVGSSVTMPWKVAIMPHLDDLTEDARQAGACNTIFRDPAGRYVGTNTDCIGIREALLQNSPNPAAFRGRPALIVGGGGTARTAIYVLRKWLGASRIYIVNRDRAENARRRSAPATSCGLFLGCEPARRSPQGVILEMCYHPVPWTEIADMASSAGWKVILGSEALIWQGLEQARLWTGQDVVAVPGVVDRVKEVVNNAIAERSQTKPKIFHVLFNSSMRKSWYLLIYAPGRVYSSWRTRRQTSRTVQPTTQPHILNGSRVWILGWVGGRH